MTTDPIVEKYAKHIIPLTILLMLIMHINTKKMERSPLSVETPTTIDSDASDGLN
tara:strand:+ start:62 stop:226 length:165 start_codon:yes stop_codon:yes gene_type:complete